MSATSENGSEHVDVLIVGAGLSGIGAASRLVRACPQKTFAVLEARDGIGGTWDLFRYPGVRSDSDMFTMGYSFRPWKQAEAIADGPSIRAYIRDTAREYGVESRIRFNHRAVRAAWSTADARWTVDVERTDTDETARLTCDFIYACTGYYRYDEGYTPRFEGRDRFAGEIVHPQHWPEHLDYSGKRVIIIGSGATAVTLVPAMAKKASHVTMVQRSPGYIVTIPTRDPFAEFLERFLPPRFLFPLVRWKNVLRTQLFFQLCRRRPEWAKALVRSGVERVLPPGIATDPHFKPRYNPWDQRVCLVPDADLFAAFQRGKASIVTNQIVTFTERGLVLASGEEIAADLIVTATGINAVFVGGMTLVVDGDEVDLSERVAYKGMMLSDVPNLALAFGYTNASWTLKCDLVSEYVCRLLNHMDERGLRIARPVAPGPSVGREPFIDLTSGYVMRSIDEMPRQGARMPWRLHQNYPKDILMLRRGPIEDEGIEFPTPEPVTKETSVSGV